MGQLPLSSMGTLGKNGYLNKIVAMVQSLNRETDDGQTTYKVQWAIFMFKLSVCKFCPGLSSDVSTKKSNHYFIFSRGVAHLTETVIWSLPIWSINFYYTVDLVHVLFCFFVAIILILTEQYLNPLWCHLLHFKMGIWKLLTHRSFGNNEKYV